MAKLQRSHILPNTSELHETPAVQRFAEKLMFFLDTTFRKIANIPFNQSESIDVADSGTANTEFTVTHHLGRVPNGYILTKTDKSANIYTSSTAWTTTAIYLKCDAANAAITVTVF